MSQDKEKKMAADAALEYIRGGDVVGVGTGSTANLFIDGLARIKGRIDGAVSSSDASAARLQSHGIEVLELNDVGSLRIYVDGADETTRHRHLIKGGGGALTREKIVAEVSETFVCIADSSKLVERLGTFPLPVEVIPMARSMVARELAQMGGEPVWRSGFLTDNRNVILDVHGLDILDPVDMESRINQIPGVVTVGLFARRGADLLLLGGDRGVEEL